MTGKKKCFLLIVAVLCLICPVWAMELSVDDAVSLAVKNNLSLKSSSVELEAARLRAENQWMEMLPKFGLGATFESGNETVVEVDGKTKIKTEFKSFDFTGEFGVSLTFNPGLVASVGAVKQEYETGKVSFGQAQEKIKAEVRKLYYSIVFQEEYLEMLRGTALSQKNVYEDVRNKYNVGSMSLSDLMESEVAYKNSQYAVRQAETEAGNAKRNLANLMGINVDEELVLTDKMKTDAVDISLDQLLGSISNRHDIKLNIAQTELAGKRRTAENLKIFVPTFSASQNFGPVVNRIGENRYNDLGGFKASVYWNIGDMLPSSENRRRATAFKDAYNKLLVEREKLIRDAEAEIRNLVHVIDNCRFEMENSVETLRLAEDYSNLVSAEHRRGSKTNVELNYATTQRNQAKKDNLNSKYRYVSSLIDLEYATSQSLF
ncbi:MAG: TolC family protein [Sphaerochaetaceae bacterium]|nr:TolC family protein [Sphaerochaetaceae bacterium]